ncbi:hypothetical protein HO173_002369 [Letharia columbiana]|uniref:O-methyltransferase domain-containing protein n=1 Tax=Letharia columbiana TaxID=112416 RepID=A0A8H6G3D8_9LECA|nr:uncharacterized protein HO173_002369 [Letharia columbiana]KAF6239823.1 hypothetical protein HO173_002369 [Letharia columbiana]
MWNSDKCCVPIHLIDHPPFEAIGKGIVVDVGGSHGQIAVPIAQQLASRVNIVAHDSCTEQPARAADVYHFRRIFHDRSGEYAVAGSGGPDPGTRSLEHASSSADTACPRRIGRPDYARGSELGGAWGRGVGSVGREGGEVDCVSVSFEGFEYLQEDTWDP